MNQIITVFLRLLLHALLLVMGLLFFASLLAAAAVLGLVWALRALWAWLTGRPVSAWGVGLGRIDPRTGFSRVFRSGARWSWGAGTARTSEPGGMAESTAAPQAASRRGGTLPGAGEVTDVEPRELR